jgi:hypothetical protein
MSSQRQVNHHKHPAKQAQTLAGFANKIKPDFSVSLKSGF